MYTSLKGPAIGQKLYVVFVGVVPFDKIRARQCFFLYFFLFVL